MKHKKEIILVLIGVILILVGAYLTSRISVKEKTEKKVEKEELKVNGEVINLKLDETMIKELIKMDGFYRAYHMNKKSWISIILDYTVDNEIIYSLIDQSYNNVNK